MHAVPMVRAVATLLCSSACVSNRHAAVRLEAMPARNVRLPANLNDYRPPNPIWEQGLPESEIFEELAGPWELQCSVSGMSSLWVEFDETGECSCSSRIGKGRKWSAVAQPSSTWRVRFVTLDKLSRQVSVQTSNPRRCCNSFPADC